MIKAQVLSGKRADVGGILFAENEGEYKDQIKRLLGSTINKEKVEQVLVEEKADVEKEYYLSISYDTQTRGPLLALSKEGGTGIEDRKLEHYVINPVDPEESLKNWEQIQLIPKDLVLKLVELFFKEDCTLLEINPLIKTKSGDWMALDAKVKLDETAIGRHPEWKEYPSRRL